MYTKAHLTTRLTQHAECLDNLVDLAQQAAEHYGHPSQPNSARRHPGLSKVRLELAKNAIRNWRQM